METTNPGKEPQEGSSRRLRDEFKDIPAGEYDEGGKLTEQGRRTNAVLQALANGWNFVKDCLGDFGACGNRMLQIANDFGMELPEWAKNVVEALFNVEQKEAGDRRLVVHGSTDHEHGRRRDSIVDTIASAWTDLIMPALGKLKDLVASLGDILATWLGEAWSWIQKMWNWFRNALSTIKSLTVTPDANQKAIYKDFWERNKGGISYQTVLSQMNNPTECAPPALKAAAKLMSNLGGMGKFLVWCFGYRCSGPAYCEGRQRDSEFCEASGEGEHDQWCAERNGQESNGACTAIDALDDRFEAEAHCLQQEDDNGKKVCQWYTRIPGTSACKWKRDIEMCMNRVKKDLCLSVNTQRCKEGEFMMKSQDCTWNSLIYTRRKGTVREFDTWAYKRDCDAYVTAGGRNTDCDKDAVVKMYLTDKKEITRKKSWAGKMNAPIAEKEFPERAKTKEQTGDSIQFEWVRENIEGLSELDKYKVRSMGISGMLNRPPRLWGDPDTKYVREGATTEEDGIECTSDDDCRKDAGQVANREAGMVTTWPRCFSTNPDNPFDKNTTKYARRCGIRVPTFGPWDNERRGRKVGSRPDVEVSEACWIGADGVPVPLKDRDWYNTTRFQPRSWDTALEKIKGVKLQKGEILEPEDWKKSRVKGEDCISYGHSIAWENQEASTFTKVLTAGHDYVPYFHSVGEGPWIQKTPDENQCFKCLPGMFQTAPRKPGMCDTHTQKDKGFRGFE